GLALEDRETREPGRFRFKHLLMRDVAYSVLPKAARADLHEAYANELERSVGDRRAEYAEIVAYHVERAFALAVEVRAPRTVVAPRARALLERAMPLGERARRRLETPLLQRYAAAAAAALAASGDEAAPEDALAVKLLQASDSRLRSEYADAKAAFTEALRLAEKLGRTDLAAQAHTGIAGTLVWTANDATEIAQMAEHATEAQRLFRAAGDVGGEVEAGLIMLDSYWASGDIDAFLATGRDLYERARAARDEPRELQLVARLIGAAANSGQLKLAVEYRTRAQELIAKLGARLPPWFRNSEINSVRRDGDLARTMELLDELETIARNELDMNLLMFRFRAAAETEAIERRRYPEAAVFCDRCLEISVRIGDRWNRAELTATRAICVAAAGDIAAAERLIVDASALADRGDVFAIAYIAYCKARVLEFAGRIDDALAADRECDERFAASGYGKGMWNGILLIDQARFLADIGRPMAAADVLARAEAGLPPQIGERAERIAKLKERIASAKAARA
ncbi:MAG TPA: hypothetical protein VI814_03050, partial [Candidatus Limnocylindria bacterium]